MYISHKLGDHRDTYMNSPLTVEEKAKFHVCCEDIRKHIKEAEAIEAVK